MEQIVITERYRDVLIISFLLPLHRDRGSVEPLAYYVRRENRVGGKRTDFSEHQIRYCELPYAKQNKLLS